MADPKIKFDIAANTSGQAGVESLAHSLENLDEAFNPALAAEAKALNAEIKALGAQQAAVQRFVELKTSTAASGAAFEQAQQAVHKFGIEVAATEVPTRSQIGAMTKLKDTLSASEVAHGANVAALRKEEQALKDAGVQTDRLQSSQVELAVKLRQAQAAGVQMVASFQQQKAASEAAAAAAQKVGETFAQAFGANGQRPISQIKADLVATRAALAAVATSGELAGAGLAAGMAKARANVAALELELRGATGQLTLMDRASASLNGLASGASSIVTKFGAAAAAVFGLGYAFRPLIDASVKLNQWVRSLTAVTGSTAEAGAAIENFRNVSQRTGTSVEDTGDAFVRFSAAMRLSGYTAGQTNGLFEAVTQAASRMGLSGERTGLVFDALAQMASKGTVSMEELRQQLGESLPGALQLMAKSLGITEQQLIKLVGSGQLLTRDALGPLTVALANVGKEGAPEVDGLTQRWNRFKNVIFEAYQVIGQSGPAKAAGVVLGGVAKAVEYLAFTLAFLGESFNVVGAQIGIAMADIQTQGLKFRGFSAEAKAAMQEVEDASTQKLTGLVGRMEGVQTASDGASGAMTNLAGAAGQAGAQAQAAAAGVQANAAAHEQAGAAASANASAQGQAGAAAQQSAQQAASASAAWVKLGVDYQAVNTATAQAVTLAEAVAKAKRLEGDSLQAVARLSGDEAAALGASAQAATIEAQALEEVAQKRQTQVDVLRAELDARQTLARTLGDADGSRQKQIEAITATIEKLQAEAQAAQSSAEASRRDALAKDLAVKAQGDNARAVDQLRQAYEEATAAVVKVTEAKRLGLATDAEVTQAADRAAVAQGLYRDAVKDVAAAFERKRDAIQRSQALAGAGLGLEQDRIATEEKYAAAVGNTAGVVRAQIAQKEIDIRITEGKVAALRAEAAALLDVARAEQAALSSSDPLLEQKKAEIQARIDNANMMRIEADRQTEKINLTRQEIDLLRNRGAAAAQSSQAVVSGLEAEIAAQERANDLKQRAVDLENKRRGVDASGFATNPATGQTITAGGNTLLSLINEFKSYGLDDAKAQEQARQFVDSRGQVPFFNNPGQAKYGASTLSEAVQAAASQALYGKDGSSARQGPASTGTNTSDGGKYVVTINLNGASSRVNVASASDAQVLTNLLRSLQDQAARAAA